MLCQMKDEPVAAGIFADCQNFSAKPAGGPLEQSFSRTNTHSEHCFADPALLCEIRGGILISPHMHTHACANVQMQSSDYMLCCLVLSSLYGRAFVLVYNKSSCDHQFVFFKDISLLLELPQLNLLVFTSCLLH